MSVGAAILYKLEPETAQLGEGGPIYGCEVLPNLSRLISMRVTVNNAKLGELV